MGTLPICRTKEGTSGPRSRLCRSARRTRHLATLGHPVDVGAKLGEAGLDAQFCRHPFEVRTDGRPGQVELPRDGIEAEPRKKSCENLVLSWREEAGDGGRDVHRNRRTNPPKGGTPLQAFLHVSPDGVKAFREPPNVSFELLPPVRKKPHIPQNPVSTEAIHENRGSKRPKGMKCRTGVLPAPHGAKIPAPTRTCEGVHTVGTLVRPDPRGEEKPEIDALTRTPFLGGYKSHHRKIGRGNDERNLPKNPVPFPHIAHRGPEAFDQTRHGQRPRALHLRDNQNPLGCLSACGRGALVSSCRRTDVRRIFPQRSATPVQRPTRGWHSSPPEIAKKEIALFGGYAQWTPPPPIPDLPVHAHSPVPPSLTRLP